MIKTILVIDDDEGILEAFRAVIESMGYRVITSADATYLLPRNKNTLPDLIILDVLLSGEDGREICKILKDTKDISHIPIVMMSAAPNIEKTIKDAGADGFLKKPFEMDDLQTIVQSYVNK